MEHFLRIMRANFTIEAGQYLIIAGIPFILLYLLFSKRFAGAKIQPRQSDRKDYFREILHSLQSTFVFALVGFLAFNTPFVACTRVYFDLDSYPFWWLPASVVLSLVVHDTYFYWLHRLLHYKRVFRFVHRLHHRSTNPSPWASYSFHLVESFGEGAVVFVILALIPMHPIALTLFSLSSFIINVYGHLGYELMPRWVRHTFLFEVINTVVHHNLHHRKFKGNYGLYFRLWDRLMKTEHPDYVSEYDRVQANRIKRN